MNHAVSSAVRQPLVIVGARPVCLRPWSMLILLPLLLSLTGCGEYLDDTYGRRTPLIDQSVNGTSVLAKMLEERGHKVSSWPWLSPKLEQRADCLVWFPNDFHPPTPKVREWLEGWLLRQPNRVLIYVGRDYDAAPSYWDQTLSRFPQDKALEARRRSVEAQARFQNARVVAPMSEWTPWFTLESASRPRAVHSLQGDERYLRGVDPAGLDIRLTGRVLCGDFADPLLESDGDLLLSREYFENSQLFVVANGSFLLNLPLVNPQHRRLASHLLDEIPAGARVVFLETDAGGPAIRDSDVSSQRFGLEMFTAPPLNYVFLHLALWGIVFTCMRFPIFGLPRRLPSAQLSDFGRHVTALGELMERSGDEAYAKARLTHYDQLLSGDRRHQALQHLMPPQAGATDAQAIPIRPVSVTPDQTQRSGLPLS